MSMNGHLRSIPAATYEQLLKDPASIRKAIWSGGHRFGSARIPAAAPGGLDDLGPTVDVDKMWQALHFIIARTPFAPGPGKAGFILGGRACGPDVGYGPARLLSPAEVATIAAELPTAEDLRGDFSPEDLAAASIYPGVWDEDADDLWGEIADSYSRVRALYWNAAQAGEAVLLWMD